MTLLDHLYMRSINVNHHLYHIIHLCGSSANPHLGNTCLWSITASPNKMNMSNFFLNRGHERKQVWWCKCVGCWISLTSGPLFTIKLSSYQYRKSHCGDKTVVRSSYLHNGISYTGETKSFHWIRALVLYSLSRWTSYRKIPPRLGSTRFGLRLFQ